MELPFGKKIYCEICGKEIKHPELLLPMEIHVNGKLIKNICVKCRNEIYIKKIKSVYHGKTKI